MEDKIFGNMSFKYGWTKNEEMSFEGNTYNVRIRTSSLKNELPTEAQQKAYLQYKANVSDVLAKASEQIDSFIGTHKEQMTDLTQPQSTEKKSFSVIPFEVLFFKNGKYAILFRAQWSDTDMCILCDKDSFKVDDSCLLEFEY